MYYQQKLKRNVLTFLLGLFCLVSFAQGQQVQGIVKDKTGEPMIGVNVLVKGTTNGTITGIDGDFILTGVKNRMYCLLLISVIREKKSSMKAKLP